MKNSRVKLIDGVGANYVGNPVAIDRHALRDGGSLPIVITGIVNATVSLQATIATKAEVDAGTANWEQISSAAWTANVSDGLFTPFTHIRGVITSWVAGTITMKTFF